MAVKDKKHRVVTLTYDNLCLFEFGIACELFGLERPEFDFPWYDFRVCSVDNIPLSGLGGIQVTAPHSPTMLDTADTIIIPGWNRRTPAPPSLLRKLKRAHNRGARLVSICSGAFLLGEAGLLDGRQATTHWRYTKELQSQFPAADVVADVLYVEDRGVFSSAGSAAGIDLSLHLVRSDYGATVANTVARRLVLPAHRSGGQAQFIAEPVAPKSSSLSPLLEWVQGSLDQDHSVATLARAAHCSERSLLRRFKAATGCSPMRWITNQRINRVKVLLEETNAPMPILAEHTGFKTVETLRHHFRQEVGISPSDYRRTFRANV